MKRTKTLLLSCLITVLVGLGLFFWLLPSKQTAKPVTIEEDSDSVVFVQPKAVVNMREKKYLVFYLQQYGIVVHGQHFILKSHWLILIVLKVTKLL